MMMMMLSQVKWQHVVYKIYYLYAIVKNIDSAHIYFLILIYEYMYIHIYIHVYIYIYIHIYAHASSYATRFSNRRIGLYMYISIHLYMYTYVYIYIKMYLSIYTYICTYPHILFYIPMWSDIFLISWYINIIIKWYHIHLSHLF
jgi:hypothetical protein